MKVFLRYFVEIPFPIQEVDRVLGELPGEWLDIAARDASVRGVVMLGGTRQEPQIGPGGVCVTLTPSARVDGGFCRSIQWLTVGASAQEVALHGDLELAELGPARTQLALSAQHRPQARVDEPLDRTTIQRVSESTLKAFVDRVASYIQNILGEQGPAADAAARQFGQAVAVSLPPGWIPRP